MRYSHSMCGVVNTEPWLQWTKKKFGRQHGCSDLLRNFSFLLKHLLSVQIVSGIILNQKNDLIFSPIKIQDPGFSQDNIIGN